MFSKFYFYHPVSVMWIASNNIFQEIIFVFFIHDISSTHPVSWQWESWTERKWLLFKRWKALSTQINHYPAEKRFIEIYPVDNIIQLLNNGGQIIFVVCCVCECCKLVCRVGIWMYRSSQFHAAYSVAPFTHFNLKLARKVINEVNFTLSLTLSLTWLKRLL